MTTTTQRPLPPDAIAGLSSIAEACDVLRAWGYPNLADRLDYLASDEDLDDGDRPATLESAQGFLAFFGAVESEKGKVDLGCSWDGRILAVWRFPDHRRVSVWFQDPDSVEYAARKSDGFFANFTDGSETGGLSFIRQNLVEAKEWFTWFSDSPAGANSDRRTTRPAIAVGETSA